MALCVVPQALSFTLFASRAALSSCYCSDVFLTACIVLFNHLLITYLFHEIYNRKVPVYPISDCTCRCDLPTLYVEDLA